MHESSGLGAASTALMEPGPESGPREPEGWPDSPKGSFAVGDEVRTTGGRLGSGVITDILDAKRFDFPYSVILNDGDYRMYRQQELVLMRAVEDAPIPYTLVGAGPDVWGEPHDRKIRGVQPIGPDLSALYVEDPWTTCPRPDWELDIESACTDLAALLIAKRKTYGPHAIDGSPWGWEIGLVTRLHEKVARLVTIVKDEGTYSFENMAESFKDIAGIGILGQIKAEKDM